MNDIGLPAELNPYMKTYFDTAVRENRYYSEDWTFCENWRDLGGRVWVDKRVLLRHTGTYVFDFQAQDQLYKDLHGLAIQNSAALPGGPLPTPADKMIDPTKLGGGMAAPVDVTAPSIDPGKPKTKVLAKSKKAKV
jgi:hypothetical protein